MVPTDLALEEIARAGAEAPGLRAYRERVLGALASLVPFDGALVHALSPRVPLSTAAMVGLDPGALARSTSGWDELAVALAPLRELANRALVATDAQALRKGSRARARFERLVARPFGVRSVCIVHLVVRERVVGAVVLFARRSGAFREEHVARLRAVAPALAVGDALHQALDGVPSASAPTRLACRDQRLTPRQREIVEHVALGHTNAEIGVALGLSPNSVRNHLARVFGRLGASNRADVVRLAVLVPAPPRARG